MITSKTHWRDYISHLVWEHLGLPQERSGKTPAASCHHSLMLFKQRIIRGMIQSQLLAIQDTVERKTLFMPEELAHSLTRSLHPPVFTGMDLPISALLCAHLLEDAAPPQPVASLPPSNHCKFAQLLVAVLRQPNPSHTNEQAHAFHSHPAGLCFRISPLSVRSLPLIFSDVHVITLRPALHVWNSRGMAKGLKSQSAR